MAFLTVLAHEIGHIKFHRPADLVQVSPCFLNSIRDPYWSDTDSTPLDRWRDFGDDIGKHKVRDSITVPKPREVGTKEHLKAIYKGGFATALASASPEEDYVETYALAVLRAYSTDELTLKLGDTADDIIVLRIRKQDHEERQEHESVLEVYLHALQEAAPMKKAA